MDLLNNADNFYIYDPLWRIYCRHYESMAQYIGPKAKLSNSMISEGSTVKGSVKESVISSGVYINEGAEVVNSVIMKNATIGKNAKVYNSIVAEDAVIGENALVGHEKIEVGQDMITVVANKDVVASNKTFKKM